MNSIGKVFNRLKAKNEGALIGYLTAGDPQPELTVDLAEALIRGGVDILELGLPFSDPIADGPTIQAASLRALTAGTTPKKVFEVADAITKKQKNLPIVIMTYYNPVFRMGLDKFFSEAKESGVEGVIVPDLPVEEADAYRTVATKQGIDTIFLAAPSTTKERLTRIIACTSGFLYLVSHFGVTGAKSAVEDSTISLVKRVQINTRGRVPLAVGFGVSKSEHVKGLVAAGAEGVIVGSAFVNLISGNLGYPDKMCRELEKTACELKQATINPV